MEFEWLDSKKTSGRLQGDDWRAATRDRARLLARLHYPKAYTLKRCEQDLDWSFGEKSNWPLTLAALKRLVTEAYRTLS